MPIIKYFSSWHSFSKDIKDEVDDDGQVRRARRQLRQVQLCCRYQWVWHPGRHIFLLSLPFLLCFQYMNIVIDHVLCFLASVIPVVIVKSTGNIFVWSHCLWAYLSWHLGHFKQEGGDQWSWEHHHRPDGPTCPGESSKVHANSERENYPPPPVSTLKESFPSGDLGQRQTD